MISWLRRLFSPKRTAGNAPKAAIWPPGRSAEDYKTILEQGIAKGDYPASPGVASSSATPPPRQEPKKKEPETDASRARDAILSGAAPAGMRLRMLDLSGVTTPFRLPPGLQCFGLNLANSAISEIPPDVQIEYKLDLTGCMGITALPAGLKTGSLVLNGCANLRALPDGLEVNFLNLEGCVSLAEWPDTARVNLGVLNARGCASLKSLPQNLGPLTNLDISGCRQIASLPAKLSLNGWLDLADTRIEGLPDTLRDVQLRWRGVNINAQIAFFPETLTTAEILGEKNAEVRRVMIERRGLEKFMKEANATVLDEDSDPGGKRQLLRVPMKEDEDLVCVSLYCPSTGRHYIIRVPPATKTCRQGVAWTAGYDNPDDYNPIVET